MSSAPVNVIVCGATGRTGNAVVHALVARDDVQLVGMVAPSLATEPTRPVPAGIATAASLEQLIAAHGVGTGAERPVVVDLTHADAAQHTLDRALAARLPVVLGATGMDPEWLDARAAAFESAGLGLMVVPNFSLGAALMVRAAALIAPHMGDAEIVELHHDAKRDAPSGTAMHTARVIAGARGERHAVAGDGASRGERVDSVPVHALRLPGASAHQTVVFGAPGELVTIRHDAIDRSCYAAGVVLAAQHARTLVGMATGLEHLL
jgi:4-hydroxy-tetrahydrodipicolinate reductase